jgi:hypothetical protein
MTRGRRHCEERDNARHGGQAPTLRKQRRAEKDGERKIATTEDAENTEAWARLIDRIGIHGKRRNRSYSGQARQASGPQISFKTHARS